MVCETHPVAPRAASPMLNAPKRSRCELMMDWTVVRVEGFPIASESPGTLSRRSRMAFSPYGPQEKVLGPGKCLSLSSNPVGWQREMAGSNLLIDHVVLLVPDAAEAARTLRERGLGSERGAYHPFAGTRNHNVPLQPPAYLEFLTIESRSAAESSEAGRAVLACEAAGFGVFSWAVLVEDLEAASSRLGIHIVDHTIPHGDGTLRGWRTITGPPQLPVLIDYPNNGDRIGRWRAMYERVGHTCAPNGFSQVTISGSER